jgi:hypothetical protein
MRVISRGRGHRGGGLWHAVGSGEPKVQMRPVGIAGLTEAGDRQTYNGVQGEPRQGCEYGEGGDVVAVGVVVVCVGVGVSVSEVTGMASNTGGVSE